MWRRASPWAVVLLLSTLLLGVLPNAFAAQGDSFAEAIQVGPGNRFAGTTGTQRSTYFRFGYRGGTEATITLEFEPADVATRTDLLLFTGSAQNPRREELPVTREATTNTLSVRFSDANDRDVFIQVVNDSPERAVSYAGRIEPATVVATPGAGTPTAQTGPFIGTPGPTPGAGTPTATAGPVADSFGTAVTLSEDGRFQGTIGPRRANFYRFFYSNIGADATITASFAPNGEGADLDVFTGADVNNLTRQGGDPRREADRITRTVNLTTAQFVYFTVVNNNDAAPLAYSGTVNPVGTPPATATATPTVAATGTAVPATATPAPTTTAATPTPLPVQPAPPLTRDARYFAQTGFRIDDDGFNAFFESRGRIDTFGYPVSRTFTFLGCTTQVFQRLVLQRCGTGPVGLINLLDPEIFPYTRVNGSTFPSPDEQIKNATPAVGTPEYAGILDFINRLTPDTFGGRAVNFQREFAARGGLEIFGAVISNPQVEPTNQNFVYQRFQRAILLADLSRGVTEPVLLADYLKAILRDQNLPGDLREAAAAERQRGTRAGTLFQQYCPGQPGWVCRPAELPGTDLTNAFEQG